MPGIKRLRRVARELVSNYLNHQSWKAHEGLFMPVYVEGPEVIGGGGANLSRSLRKLAGVKLSAKEAEAEWPRVLEHKWYMGERLGRDVGLRVAAADYFENIHPPRARRRARRHDGGLPPRLPMMMSLGQRS